MPGVKLLDCGRWSGGTPRMVSRVIAVEASYRTIEAALKAEIERLRP